MEALVILDGTASSLYAAISSKLGPTSGRRRYSQGSNMSPLESLMQSVEGAASLDGALDALLDGLAQRIKATSNDQNVQRLAREIRIIAPSLVAKIAAKGTSERASA